MTNKEKELLKTIGLYFLESSKIDGDFDKSWLNNWSMDEINKLNGELLKFFAEVDHNIPDYFILCAPISVTFRFLLWKLTERNTKYSLSIDNYR